MAKIPPGKYTLRVRDPHGEEVHSITVNAVHTKDPHDRVRAVAKGALNYALEVGRGPTSVTVHDTDTDAQIFAFGELDLRG